MKQFIVTVENKQKIGLYYFSHFNKKGNPVFECSWCNSGGTRVYKTKGGATRLVNRLKRFYKGDNYTFSITDIGEATTGAELHYTAPDGFTVVVKYFNNEAEAKAHAEYEGIIDYDIYPMPIIMH